MPNPVWIAAAKQTDREPVILMAIESVNALKSVITTQADWGSSKSLTNCNIATEPGTIFCATDGDEPTAGTYSDTVSVGLSANWNYTAAAYDSDGNLINSGEQLAKAIIGFPGLNNHVTNISLQCRVVTESIKAPPLGNLTLEVSLSDGPWTIAKSQIIYIDGTWTITTLDLPRGNYNVRLTFDPTGSDGWGKLYCDYATFKYQTCYLAGSLQTETVDLGLVPTVSSTLQIDSYIPARCALGITARGSSDGSVWNNLGTVVDGSSLPPYRYYDFTITLSPSSDYLNSPELYEIRVVGGNSQYTYIGTHEDTPIRGVRPLLINTLGSVTAKLELNKLGTIGEISPKMFYVKETMEFLRDGYLRDKALTVFLGFKGIALADYEPIFTGYWYDATIEWKSMTVQVKTRTLFSRFQKAQVPAEQGGVRTAQTVQPKIWSQVNIVAVILDLLSYLGLPPRFIDTDAANAIMSGPRSGNEWLVERELNKDNKAEALTLLQELSVLSGITITQLGSGLVTFDLYDPAAPIDTEITTDICTVGSIGMGQANLYTRQEIFWEPKHENDPVTGYVYGGWLPLKTYAMGDSVPTQTALSYHALISHTSAYINQPGLGSLWKTVWAPSWMPEQSYAVGDKVVADNNVFVCNTAHLSTNLNKPGVGSVWNAPTSLTLATAYGVWTTGLSVSANDSIIASGGAVWICILSHTTDSFNQPGVGTLSRAYWTTNWATGTNYVAGDKRISNGPLYTCRFDHTSSRDTEPGRGPNWRSYWNCQPVTASDNDEDYYNCYQEINAQAEIDWGLNADVQPTDPDYLKNPGYSKKVYNKWGLQEAALATVAERMDGWFSNPKCTTKLTDLPIQFMGLRLGRFIGITVIPSPGKPVLVFPTADSYWGVPIQKKKFRIMGTTFDESKCTIALDILEV